MRWLKGFASRPRGLIVLGNLCAAALVVGVGLGTGSIHLPGRARPVAVSAPPPSNTGGPVSPGRVTPPPATPAPSTPAPAALTADDVGIGTADLPPGYTLANDLAVSFSPIAGATIYDHVAPAVDGMAQGVHKVLHPPDPSTLEVFCDVVFYATAADAQADVAHRYAAGTQPRLGVRPHSHAAAGVGSDEKVWTLAVAATGRAPGVLGDGFSEVGIVWRVGSVSLELTSDWPHVGQAATDFNTAVALARTISARAAQVPAGG